MEVSEKKHSVLENGKGYILQAVPVFALVFTHFLGIIIGTNKEKKISPSTSQFSKRGSFLLHSFPFEGMMEHWQLPT